MLPPSPPRAQAFEAWLGDQQQHRTDTGALPASCLLLEQARAFLAALGTPEQMGPWELSRQRLLRMAIVPYGHTWEQRLGQGVWTDGVRIWIAESTLMSLSWESLMGSHDRVPVGISSESRHAWTRGPRSWPALVQALVQAAGQTLDPAPRHWPIKQGRQPRALSTHPAVHRGLRPWARIRADLLRVAGGAVAISRHGWEAFSCEDFQAHQTPGHDTVVKWKRQWMSWLITGSPETVFDRSVTAYHGPCMLLEGLCHGWVRELEEHRLAQGDVMGALAASVWTAAWLHRRHLPWSHLAAVLDKAAPLTAAWTPQDWERGLGKLRTLPRGHSFPKHADLWWEWFHPPALHALYTQRQGWGFDLARVTHGAQHRHGLPLRPIVFWRVGALLAADQGMTCPEAWADEIHRHGVWASVCMDARDQSVFAHLAQQSPFRERLRLWDLDAVPDWERKMTLLELAGPRVQHNVRTGKALQDALAHKAPDAWVKALWNECDKEAVVRGPHAQTSPLAPRQHVLMSLQQPRHWLALLQEGLSPKARDGNGSSLLQLVLRPETARNQHDVVDSLVTLTAQGASWEGGDGQGESAWDALWALPLFDDETASHAALDQVVANWPATQDVLPAWWHLAHASAIRHDTVGWGLRWLDAWRARAEQQHLRSTLDTHAAELRKATRL